MLNGKPVTRRKNSQQLLYYSSSCFNEMKTEITNKVKVFFTK